MLSHENVSFLQFPENPKAREAQEIGARPFSRDGSKRIVIAYHKNRIALALVNAFTMYEEELKARYDVEIRLVDSEFLMNGGELPFEGVDRLLLQAWHYEDRHKLVDVCQRVKDTMPDCKITYLDPTEVDALAMANTLDPYIDTYLKRTLFKDKNLYKLAFRGGTYITDIYGKRAGLSEDPMDWQVPDSVIPKLHAVPNFFTAPFLAPNFLKFSPPRLGNRPIDLHARLGVKGSPIYEAMRGECVELAKASPAENVVTGSGIPWQDYMDEMRQTKICFSPVGYGDICWREFEGFLLGGAVIKNDMSHLITKPDFYIPEETYLPFRWDYSDLDDVIERLLKDADLRAHLAHTSFEAVKTYLHEKRFIDEIGFLFEMT